MKVGVSVEEMYDETYPVIIRFVKELGLFRQWKIYTHKEKDKRIFQKSYIDKVFGSANFTDYLLTLHETQGIRVPDILNTCSIVTIFRWWMMFQEYDFFKNHRTMVRTPITDVSDKFLEYFNKLGFQVQSVNELMSRLQQYRNDFIKLNKTKMAT